MPIYVNAKSTQNNELFADCGTEKIAGNHANLHACAVKDFAYVYDYQLFFHQPMSHFGTPNHSTFQHELSLVLPNYQPLQAMLMSLSNAHQSISTLTINQTRRASSEQEEITGQLIGTNGAIKQFNIMSLENSGRIIIKMLFEKLTHEDKLTQKSGLLQSTH